MDRQQAQQLIKDTFENPFDKGRFSRFVRNLLNHLEDAPFIYQGTYIPEKYRRYIRTLERIGKYSDGESTLDVLTIILRKETSLERARTMQRNFVAWYLNGSRGGEMKDAALVAFVSPDQTDWRFSLVKMDYKFEKTKTGKMKVKEEFTPARRWSFLVGVNEKSHTAQSRLVKILADDDHNPSLAELEEAFNIETVTKEFFLKYRELFLRTKHALDSVVANDAKVQADFDAKGVDTVNFAKKLLGQIVFLYFLQKKGWFGVGRDDEWGTGSKHFLRQLFSGTHGRYRNFFNDILEPLFYEALRIDRRHDDDYYSRFNCKIPFLNGGLFDPINNYDWVHTDIHLPNEIFSNENRTREGDVGDGILDVFDRYNFTVREDEPLEKEVAIDPELLGKAYEKFNAIRPDNFDDFIKAVKSGKKGDESKFNKKFGVYYTPREIVHYMCQQSLINYLYTSLNEAATSFQPVGSGQTSAFGNDANRGQLAITTENRSAPEISKTDIEDLIVVGEFLTEHEAVALEKAQNIKSGVQQSTEYTALLPASIRANAALIDKCLADITVCDPAVGSGAFPVGMMNEIVRARNVLSVFLKDETRTDYQFKRRCIEHSLYGVDIDPGAVEIAKLRLWLSLVVDEEDIRRIRPLPNLDYKIVCGNSLLSVEKDFFNSRLFTELERLKPLHLAETNPNRKQAYKAQIDELINRITNGHTEFDFEVYFSEVFHRTDGFDVVIANPPYIQIQKLRSEEKTILAQEEFKTYSKSADIYCLFYERGLEICRQKGVLIYISSNKFLRAGYGTALRKFLHENYVIALLIDFGELPIFEAGTDPCILMVTKRLPKSEPIRAAIVKDYSHIQSLDSTLSKISFMIDHPSLRNDGWTLKNTGSLHLLDKIRNVGRPLGEYVFNKFYYGIKTGFNEAFVINHATRDQLIAADPRSIDLIKPWLRGKDIKRWYADYQGVYLINILSSSNKKWPWSGKERENAKKIFEKEYPAVFKHLEQFNKNLINRDDQGQYYWELRSCAYHEEFEKPKIVYADIAKVMRASYDSDGTFCANTMYIIPTDNLFLLGILNSKLFDWYARNVFQCLGDPWKGGRLRFIAQYMKNTPIMDPSLKQESEIVKRVKKILSAKQNNPLISVTNTENEIDWLVYQLYGLTEEEIRIVEGSYKE